MEHKTGKILPYYIFHIHIPYNIILPERQVLASRSLIKYQIKIRDRHHSGRFSFKQESNYLKIFNTASQLHLTYLFLPDFHESRDKRKIK